jgi:hypothetical protein
MPTKPRQKPGPYEVTTFEKCVWVAWFLWTLTLFVLLICTA